MSLLAMSSNLAWVILSPSIFYFSIVVISCLLGWAFVLGIFSLLRGWGAQPIFISINLIITPLLIKTKKYWHLSWEPILSFRKGWSIALVWFDSLVENKIYWNYNGPELLCSMFNRADPNRSWTKYFRICIRRRYSWTQNQSRWWSNLAWVWNCSHSFWLSVETEDDFEAI